MNVRTALAEAERRLAAAGVDTPRVDAELLVAHLLGTTRSGLVARLDDEVPTGSEGAASGNALEPLLARREGREPLAYVLGEWGFRRLVLRTDARALVPRPETETLVERALALLEGSEAPRVLDVGVGSGAIALALADERPDALVTGVDVSATALELAGENAARLGLAVELREGGIETAGEGWDLVAANPPYVATLDGLQPELRFEPETALLGTGFHERIARAARTRFLVLEVGDGEAGTVAETLRGLGYEDVRITADLGGRERVVEGRRG
ncbi:MAG TPA: HemK/PrmC family methyltransferase [Gaiellaceae bacterium]|nr:HemK/PrmC family methyltransferase [Gaiellaceae bacterium]